MAILVAGWWLAAGGADARTGGFTDWAVVVVAGDWRSQYGSTQAFDNARRDLSEAFVKAGFRRDNLRQFLLRPDRAGDDLNVVVPAEAVQENFVELARRARSGCLLYITSHGSPAGAVFGPSGVLSPSGLDQMLTRACGPRPTIVIISACYSGIFVPVVSRPNRMVLTAARADRSSFGCGEKNHYPYFDACVIETLPKSKTFLELAVNARACVTRMESETGMSPPSEPQASVGPVMATLLPTLQLNGP